MFKRRKMRFNGEWSLLAGNRVYELSFTRIYTNQIQQHQVQQFIKKMDGDYS